MDGFSGKLSTGGCRSGDALKSLFLTSTGAMKRNPFLAKVRMKFCLSPLSPIAFLTALIRLVRVDSETIRPPHTVAMRSSFETTRSRFSIR